MNKTGIVGRDAVLYTCGATSGSLPLELSHVVKIGATPPCVVRSFLCLLDHCVGSGALVILPEDRSVGQAIDT